jgi:hypothetical protein
VISCKYYIYSLIDPRNGSPFYVGKGVFRRYKNGTPSYRQRMNEHVEYSKRGDKMQNGKKYFKIMSILSEGYLDVEYKILWESNDATDQDSQEIRFISELGKSFDLTNISLGGTGGRTRDIHPLKGKKMSKEWREKLSIAKKGKPSLRKGIPHTEETKNKIRIARSQQLGTNHPRWIEISFSEAVRVLWLNKRLGFGYKRAGRMSECGALKAHSLIKLFGKEPCRMIEYFSYMLKNNEAYIK